MLDLLVYWFMFPACILMASLAMFTGISGTAMLTPFIILIFPLLHVPLLTPAQAIGMALLTEFFGFLSGVIGYSKKRLIDYKMARNMIVVSVPAIIIFSVISQSAPALALKITYGVLMVFIAAYLLLSAKTSIRNKDAESLPKELDNIPAKEREKEFTVIKTVKNKIFRYKRCNRQEGRLITFIASAFEGSISVGLGELEMPNMIRYCKIPVAVAAATSVFIIAVTVLSGALIDVFSIFAEGGLANIPVNLILYTVPGAIIGGQIGSRFQGVLSSRYTERIISIVFSVIGVAFLYVTLPNLI